MLLITLAVGGAIVPSSFLDVTVIAAATCPATSFAAFTDAWASIEVCFSAVS